MTSDPHHRARFPHGFAPSAFILAGLLAVGALSTRSGDASAIPPGTRPWRYIVVHHSGASSGNEAIIEAEHLRRGMENGMAYHFLIGNGSAGLGDGAVVEGRRWKLQLQGGHCHQEVLNEHGIGICLVGNFNEKRPTPQQIKALAALILRLRGDFSIQEGNIHGHGHFFGEDSECPGRQFPWTNLWSIFDELYQSRTAEDAGSKTHS